MSTTQELKPEDFRWKAKAINDLTINEIADALAHIAVSDIPANREMRPGVTFGQFRKQFSAALWAEHEKRVLEVLSR